MSAPLDVRHAQGEVARMAEELDSMLKRCRAIVRELKRTPEYRRADAAFERAGESGLAGIDGQDVLVWNLAGDLETDVLDELEFPAKIESLRGAAGYTAESAKAEAVKAAQKIA